MEPRPDTRMGGGRESFPSTAWSTVLAHPNPASPERRAGLSRLFSRYWRPVFAFIRVFWGKSVEDAKDLTQSFFCHILERDLVSRFQPERGRFRNFLKAVLRNFLAEAHREGKTEKRGGSAVLVSMEGEELEVADAAGRTPEEIFDREWAREVMDQSLDRLQHCLAEEGKREYMRVYEAYELSRSGAPPTYEEVARDLDLSVSDVRNRLHHVRARLREILLQIVSEYVSSPDETLEELKDLFSA